MDILSWLVDDECESISSFGELSFFNNDNKPEGAADRCVSCKIEDCVFMNKDISTNERWMAINCSK